MARIQHDAYVIPREEAEEIVHFLRLQGIEAGPEDVFKEHFHRWRDFRGQGAVHFCRRFQHVPVGVTEAACPYFIQGAVGHVPHQVLRLFRQGGADVPADCLYPVFHRHSTEGVYEGFSCGEIFFVEIFLSQIEIHPVRPVGQMTAQGEARRRMRGGLGAVNQVLNAVQMEFFYDFFHVPRPLAGHDVMTDCLFQGIPPL